jgi:hypothetical protein
MIINFWISARNAQLWIKRSELLLGDGGPNKNFMTNRRTAQSIRKTSPTTSTQLLVTIEVYNFCCKRK